MARTSRGRQKIAMEKMKNESNLQVTFSKRRSGLFKKAMELCVLCGVEVGLVVFSPGQKVYSIGHPSVDAIINKYLNHNNPSNSGVVVPPDLGTNPLVEAHRNAVVQELCAQFNHVESLLAMEKERGEEMDRLRRDERGRQWWDVPNKDDLSLEQLQELKGMMEGLRGSVDKERERIVIQAQSHRGPPIVVPPPMGAVPNNPFAGVGCFGVNPAGNAFPYDFGAPASSSSSSMGFSGINPNMLPIVNNGESGGNIMYPPFATAEMGVPNPNLVHHHQYDPRTAVIGTQQMNSIEFSSGYGHGFN